MSKIIKLREKIDRATSSTLRDDNWQYILDVCDIIREDPEEYGNCAVEIIITNLKQNDANVIMRTLSLILSMAENCGSRIEQKIDNKKMTGVLRDLIENPNVHVTVKRKIMEVVRQLSKSFKSDPSLRYISDFYKYIKSDRHYSHLIKHQNESSPAATNASFKPESNAKEQSSTNEDQDFKRALQLSLQEFEVEKERNEHKTSQLPQQATIQSYAQAQSQAPPQAPTQSLQQTSSAIRKVRAMYDLVSQEEGELSFRKGDIITVLEQVYRDWWKGTLRGKIGIFPLNYVTPITELSPQDTIKEKEFENSILSQKTNIDKLQALLNSNKNSSDLDLQDQQLNEYYSSITPLRPQIAKMIGKYSQKKDDLTSLRQVLANAEATYNRLLDKAANSYIPPSVPQSQTYAPIYNNNASSQPPQQYQNNVAMQTQQLPAQPYNNYTNPPQAYNQNIQPHNPQQVIQNMQPNIQQMNTNPSTYPISNHPTGF